jgi:hypothetical protein
MVGMSVPKIQQTKRTQFVGTLEAGLVGGEGLEEGCGLKGGWKEFCFWWGGKVRKKRLMITAVGAIDMR